MSRTRRHANRRSCASKLVYSSELAARLGAQATLTTIARKRPRLWVYRCPCCSCWHVTADDRNKTAAVTRQHLHEPGVSA